MFTSMVTRTVRRLKTYVRHLAAAWPQGLPVAGAAEAPPLEEDGPFYASVFDHDGLRTDPQVISNHDFMREPRYVAALQRGIQAHGEDPRQYWRLHVALWSAAHALRLPGDFVECGVWKGFLSAAIMRYLDWNRQGRQFYLFDTFRGLDESQCSEGERSNQAKLAHFRRHYTENYAQVVAQFREFRRVHVIRGSVPASLGTVTIRKVSYLSLDMHNVNPEVAAARHFWDKLVPGGIILLDDYGFVSYEEQKKGFDQFAREKGVEILALPTGQGLILKP
jgi:hypothetical protein